MEVTVLYGKSCQPAEPTVTARETVYVEFSDVFIDGVADFGLRASSPPRGKLLLALQSRKVKLPR